MHGRARGEEVCGYAGMSRACAGVHGRVMRRHARMSDVREHAQT